MTKVDNKFLEEAWGVTGKMLASVIGKIIPIPNLDDMAVDAIERLVDLGKNRIFEDGKNLFDIIRDEIGKEISDYLKKYGVSEFAKSRLAEFKKNGLSKFNMELLSQENGFGDILLDFCRENNITCNVSQEKELNIIAKDIELNVLNSLNNEKSIIQFCILIQNKKSDKIIHTLDQISMKIDDVYNELVDVSGDELDYYKNFFKPLCFHSFTRAKVSMFDVFVMPEVEYKDKTVTAEHCVKDFLASGDPLLLLLGQGGYGKTSFVCWISRNCRRITDRPVHIIRLRDYFAYTIDEIYDNIINKIPLKKLEDDALIVLDGLDELCMAIGNNGSEVEYSTALIKKLFELLGNHNDRRLIITSRNVFMDSKLLYSNALKEFNKEYHYFAKHNFNLHVAKLKPLNNQLRRRLIENLAEKDSNISRDSYIYKYLNEFDSETEDNSVFGSPFIVYLMCAAPNSNNNDLVIDEECINNRWLLFRRFFYDIYINPEYSENGSRAGMCKYREELYSITCEIAFRMYKSQYSKLYFTRDEVQKIVHEMLEEKSIKGELVDNKLIEYLTTCHSLSCYFDNSNSENCSLEFVHNVVRDFFVCEYILRGLNEIYNKDMDESEKGKLVSYWLSDHLMYLPLYKSNILIGDNNIGQIYLQALEAAYKIYPQLIENSGNNDNLHYIFDVFVENGGIHKFNYDLDKINIEKANANILFNSAFIYMNTVKKSLQNNQKIKWFEKHKFGTYKLHPPEIIRCFAIKQIRWYNKAVLLEYMKNFLESADLSDVSLMYADLSGANLKDADLKGANLRYASLGQADLSGADLKFAYLPNAILESTNFRNAINLNKANLIGATYNSETVFPDEFDQEKMKCMIYNKIEAD